MKLYFNFFSSIFFSLLLLSATPIKNSSQEALSRLTSGNKRYVKGETEHPSLASESKMTSLEKEIPWAVIVGCSDARVPPEIVFDQGLGDLFVVRIAGNVIGPIELDSVEFAVAKLNIPLVIVLGHQDCKAVEATLKGRENVPELDAIYPLIDAALKTCVITGADSLKNAIQCNVQKGVAILKQSPTMAPLIKQKKVKIVGAYYNIDTGAVSFLEN